MRQINCYIPIRVCITGRLSDVQLGQLEQTLTRAITARMEQARHTLSEYGHAPAGETVASAREPFEQARLANGSYDLPSYDEGGKTVRVQVISSAPSTGHQSDPLEEDWQVESDNAARLAVEGSSPKERAFGHRLSLLLSELRPVHFADEDQVVAFIDRCHQLAASEADALKAAAAAKRLTEQDLLDGFGAGFPNTWADKVYKDFHSSVDLDALQKTYQSRRKVALSIAASIPAELWARGLPLSIEQARNLKEGDITLLVLGRHRLKETPSEVTNAYAQALFRWSQAGMHYSFVKNYESNVVYARELLRRGELIGDPALYRALTKSFGDFRRSLQEYERGAIEELIAKGWVWVDITDASDILGSGYRAPTEGIDAFWKQIRDVDKQIAAAGVNDCLSRAFTWAFERNFFITAGLEVWESIKENGWKMLISAAAIFGVQFVPGLNIAVDIVLIIEFGFDILSTLADLKTALTDASTAKSVLDMEHASAQLAQTLVGTGAKVMLWAIAWAGGKLVNKVAKYRQGKQFIDEHGDTPEVRKALGDARGDVAKAERNLTAERERLAAEARQRQQQQATNAPKDAPQPARPEPAKPATEPAPKPATEPAPKPATEPVPKPARTVAEIERELQSKGLGSGDLRKFAGGAKRMTAAVAKRVAKLMEHFTPEDVKKLGEFLSEHKIALDDAAVDVLIANVPKGKMGAMIRDAEIAHAHGQATGGSEWSADELAAREDVTIHPGKPPRTREIVETPGNEVLRANLIKRFKEEPPPGYHAHHIIPEREFGAGLDWMRKRLQSAGSNINEAENGVFLAGSRSTANPELTRLHNSYIHAGRSKEYAYTLTRRLGDLHGAKFLKELGNIAEEMRTGKFKIDEIPYGWKGKWEAGMTAPIEPGFQPGLIEE